MSAAGDRPVEIFCSYAHEDESFLDELKKHLALLERQEKISWWHDRAIRPGDDFGREIEQHLDRAEIVLLLVSNDFLASSYCYDVELPRALARHDAGRTRVIPLLVRSADWTGASFESLEGLPFDGKAIAEWDDRDAAYRSVAIALREEVERIRNARRRPEVVQAVRKPVTVVSVVLEGPADDAERFNLALERSGDAAKAVLGSAGDEVRTDAGVATAFFGVPRLQGDEAMRGVRAAYDAVAAIRAAGGRARTGVATGEALVHGGGQPAVTGSVVGVAAELAWAAPEGAILLDDETQELVRSAVLVEPGELATGAAAHRLLDLVEAEPFEASFVDRAEASDALDNALTQAIRARSAYLFTVVGDAGVGKSRLIREFRWRVDHRVQVISGRCRTERDGATFLPVIEAIREAVGLTPDDDIVSARSKIEPLLSGDAASGQITDRITQLIGLTEPRSNRDETFWAIRKVFEALASRRPLVVVLEGLERAQPTLLALIEEVAHLSRDVPILLVCLARTEFLDEYQDWGGGKLASSSMQLGPLEACDCRRLIEDIVGLGLPDRLARRIVDRADGNPLFVADTLAMLVDDGLIERASGRCRVTSNVDTIAIPTSVRALVAARIERLPAAERDVLERAAVEGRVFHAGALAALAGDSSKADVGALLVSLIRKDIVRPDEPRVPLESAFRFRHGLIREVAYKSLPVLVRSSLHERLADWYERSVGEHPGVSEEFIGFHLERAYMSGDLGGDERRMRSLAERGGQHLAAAGRRAAARGDAPAASDLLGRAVDLLRDAPDGLAAEIDYATALVQSGSVAEAQKALERTIKSAVIAGDSRIEWYARLEWAGLKYDRQPELGTNWLRNQTERGRSVFEKLDDDLGLAKAWRLIGYVDVVACRWESARVAYEQAFARARRADGYRDESAATVALFFCLVFGPEPVETAINRCTELVARARRSRSVEALGLAALAALSAMKERFDDAGRLAVESRAILDDLGQVRRSADAAALWSSAEQLRGDCDAALATLRKACRIAGRTGDEGQRASFGALLAEVLLALDREDLAARAVSYVAAHADDGDIVSQVKWRQVKAAILVRRGDVSTAEPLAREAVALARASDDLNSNADALAVLSLVLRRSGRADEAAGAVAAAIELYQRKGNLAAERRIRRMLRQPVLDAEGRPVGAQA